MNVNSKAGVRKVILDKKERKALSDAYAVLNDLALYDSTQVAADGALCLDQTVKRIDAEGVFSVAKVESGGKGEK